jgi:hypothetical protein
MGSNPIGPTGPHPSEKKPAPPITTKSGAAAQPQEEIGPNGPHVAPVEPNKPADIGPSGPHTS